MYRYVVPWISEEQSGWREDVYYIVASLFAFHPVDWETEFPVSLPNLGASFARLAEGGSQDSIEHRFVTLLSTHQEDLHVQMRHAVSLLRSKDIPIAWGKLLEDLKKWPYENRWVQRSWAKEFWGRMPQNVGDVASRP